VKPPDHATGPAVSILIPARNEARNIGRLLTSIREQEYPSYEVLVYDDASEDNTARIVEERGDKRVRLLRGSGPPVGWVGKVYALYEATRHAQGEVLLFLDADARLVNARALGDLIDLFCRLPAPRVLSGLTRLRGGGSVLVSLIPMSLLSMFPLFAAPRGRRSSTGTLNGQCWVIERQLYLDLEPHRAVRNEVLEDVLMGRYLKSNGAAPHILDLQRLVEVYMYDGFVEAWHGFRKNAYPLLGGTPARFLVIHVAYLFVFVAAPLTSLWALGGLFIIKAISDRVAGYPFWLSLGAPLSTALAGALQLDSAVAHWTGRARWKGRSV
jgi:glycosyltransferase involved in cell wall biosynthesis